MIRNMIKSYVKNVLSRLNIANLLSYIKIIEIKVRWIIHRNNFFSSKGETHGLSVPLVVSLTSYPPRFKTLSLTLKCLMMQTTLADEIVLWVASADKGALPADVTALEDYGLKIRTCNDIRSYKKLIPQMMLTPDAAIITTDDDVYYPPQFVSKLVGSYAPGTKEILCGRAHRVVSDKVTGAVRAYSDWEFETRTTDSSLFVFPTGVGGVLYMPGVVSPEILDESKFLRYCPNNDDVWFYFMGAAVGTRFRRVDCGVNKLVLWSGSQDSALWNQNLTGGQNDLVLKTMIAHYGNPWSLAA